MKAALANELALVVLCTFGIARARTAATATDLAGKPYYLSPELLEGEVSNS